MSAKEREAKAKELIADFHSRIEGLRRDGLRYEESTSGFVPWAYAPENLKLEAIVVAAQSAAIAGGNINVPGTVVLEAVERDVDYSKLSEIKRNFLEELRANLSQVAKDFGVHPDWFATMALERLIERLWFEQDHFHDRESGRG
jgi:hypothetical protein